MCRYEYYSHGACGHSVIDCHEFCGMTLWRAGVTGVLVLCVPEILAQSIQWSGPKEDEPPQPTDFIGLSNYCDACAKELQLHDNVSQRVPCFGYRTDPDAHNPQAAAPYFQAKRLLTTFPHLLAIDQLYISDKMDLGPAVLFPEQLEKLTWAGLRQQQPYKIAGDWTTNEGMPPVKEVLNNLKCASGLSPQDRIMFVHVVTNNLDINEFYKDVYKGRGMPHRMFSRIITQVSDRAKIIRSQDGMRVTGPTHQLVVTVQPSSPQAVNNVQDASLVGPSDHCVTPDDEDAADGPRGTKRLLDSMQEEASQSIEPNSNPQQSLTDQGVTESPAKRARHSQPADPSLDSNVPCDPTNAATPSSQLASPTVGGPGASSNNLPQSSHSAQALSTAQQPGTQRHTGQFDIAACRDMQAQARAAQAVPLPPPSAEALQAQAASLQAAQARASQIQPPQSQASQVNAFEAQILQAQYRRSQAPSEIEASQLRTSGVQSGFHEDAGSRGPGIDAVELAILQLPGLIQEPLSEGHQNSLVTTQSPIQPSLMEPFPGSQPLIDQCPIDHPAAVLSAVTPSPIPQQPVQLYMENIPGKGRGVLPHVIAKATFFTNNKEQVEAIGKLERAWTAYSRSPEGSAIKEKAGSWIVNFSNNFQREWVLFSRPGGSMRRTTCAQLAQNRHVVRPQSSSSSSSAPHAGRSPLRQG